MDWTNRYNLPQPVVALISENLYDSKRQAQLEDYCQANALDPKAIVHFSASDLIRPPRMRALLKRYGGKIVKDVSQEIFRILGQAIHYFLREAAILGKLDSQGYKAEERLFFHMMVNGQMVVISGEPDIVSPEGRIQDYKTVAVYSWIKGAKLEWEQQTNIYAFLRDSKGLQTKGLDICFILRDWNLNETVQEGYPQAGAQMQEVPVWSTKQQLEYITERVRLHLQAEGQFDDELGECTSEEMWEKPDCWAVIRDGLQRAAKVFSEDVSPTARDEAFKDQDDRNTRLKKGEKPYVVQHRPGERTRCTRFCDVKGYCSQYNEYVAAAFRGKPEEVSR